MRFDEYIISNISIAVKAIRLCRDPIERHKPKYDDLLGKTVGREEIMRVDVVVNSLLLALGLALEAFMVALANGLKTANMRLKTACLYGIVFAACHVVALFAGFALIKTVAIACDIENILAWIAVVVLAVLGVKMIAEGARDKTEKSAARMLEFFVQSAVASFDAFAVGLTVPDYSAWDTAFCAATIAAVIAVFFVIGFAVGKKFGARFTKLAAVIGGLVFIGLAVEVAVGAWA